MSRPLVLFDMDGTLLDTRADIVRAANKTRAELALDPLADEQIIAAVGDGINAFVERVFAPSTADERHAAKSLFAKVYEHGLLIDTAPFPGIEEMLAQFQRLGTRMGVVSNKPEAMVISLIEQLNWRSYFDVILGGDSSPRTKPHPDPLIEAAHRARLSSPSTILMVGDGHQDIGAAKAVGAKSVWVNWGFVASKPEDATYVVSQPHEIVAIWKNL